MGKKSGDEEYSHGGAKDSRKSRKREEEARAHHVWYERTGPDVIIRSQLGRSKTSNEAEDLFAISSDNVSYSLNKGKRWEKVQNPEQTLHQKKSSGKTSFVKASVPHYTGKQIFMMQSASELDHDALSRNKGGIKKYVEAMDGEITVKSPKSNRANISSLERNDGPGPLLKANRHRGRTAKGKIIEEGSLSDPSEDQHTRYSTIEANKRNPKDIERSWRSYQSQSNNKGGWTRERRTAEEDRLDYYSDLEQDSLENRLGYEYEYQIDNDEAVLPPKRKEKAVKKPPTPFAKKEKKTEELPLTPKQLRELREEEKKREQEEREVKRIEKENVLAKMKEEEYRDRFIELRPRLSSSSYMEHVLVKAKEYFNEAAAVDSLQVFPRTIIVHKEDSEKVLGSKMERCTFIAASNVPGEVNIYAAPRFCCTPQEIPEPIEGWQSHARNEEDVIITSDSVVAPASSECFVCKKTEEIEELGDTVVVKHPSLFSFSCGHVACHSCWLGHAKNLGRQSATKLTCIDPQCKHTPTVSEASVLFSDGTLEIFRGFQWDAMGHREGAVPCHSCKRLLFPVKHFDRSAAFCVCGSKTCRNCKLRDHLPISCDHFKKWEDDLKWGPFGSAPMFYWGLHSWWNRMTPADKKFLKDCRKCGAERTLRWKNWCNKCCYTPWHGFAEKMFSDEEFLIILEARGRMMDGQAKIDRNLVNPETLKETKKVIDDGVFLFEHIKMSRIHDKERTVKANTDREDRQLEELEHSLDSVLLEAIDFGEEPEKKIEALKKKMETIRHQYSLHM